MAMINNIFIINAVPILPVTMTINEACQRHLGLEPSTLQDMCIQQKIRSQKVGKRWHVEIADLDRVFLGKR